VWVPSSPLYIKERLIALHGMIKNDPPCEIREVSGGLPRCHRRSPPGVMRSTSSVLMRDTPSLQNLLRERTVPSPREIYRLFLTPWLLFLPGHTGEVVFSFFFRLRFPVPAGLALRSHLSGPPFLVDEKEILPRTLTRAAFSLPSVSRPLRALDLADGPINE